MAIFKANKLDFLVSLYTFCIVVSELMGSKTFAITQIGDFKLNASVAIFVIPIVFTINDVIVEVYGKERARGVVRSGLIMVFLIMLYCLLATNLPSSSRFLPSEAAYDDVFGKATRIAIASITAFAVSEFFDVYIFSKMREVMHGKALWLRNNASNFIAQFVDGAVFIFLAFYSLNQGFGENFHFLIGLIIPYWLLRCLMSVLGTPFTYLGVRWLQLDLEAPKKA